MKKLISAALLAAAGAQAVCAASAEQYVMAVEKINSDYKQQTRDFFNTLDPMQRGFSADQQAKFCGILSKYADDLYKAADKNRTVLDRQYAGITKQDVNKQVLSSKEIQILKQYNVQCNLN